MLICWKRLKPQKFSCSWPGQPPPVRTRAAAAAVPPAGGAGPPGQALLSPGIPACCGLSSRRPTVCNINSTITLLFLCCSGHAVRPGPQRPTWGEKGPQLFRIPVICQIPLAPRGWGEAPPWPSCKAPRAPTWRGGAATFGGGGGPAGWRAPRQAASPGCGLVGAGRSQGTRRRGRGATTTPLPGTQGTTLS